MNQKSDKWIFYPSTEYGELVLDKKQTISKYSFGLASLLTQLRSFQYELKEFRKKFKVSPFYQIPEGLEYSKHEDWLKSLTLNYEELFFAGDYICFLYRLPNDWQLPFMTAIVSDFLPIPIQLSPIEIYQPDNPISFKNNKFPDHLARYPALVIKKKIPFSAVRTWLEVNKSKFNKAVESLYVDDPLHSRERTLFWGMVASLVYREYPHIDPEFQDRCIEHAHHLSNTKDELDYVELNTYRKRFEKALDQIDFLSS